MKQQTLWLLLIGVLSSVGCTSITDLFRTRPGYGIAELGRRQITDSLDAELLADLTLDYVNLYRARFNLPRLNLDPRAVQCAQWMASYQADRGNVTHVAADVPGMRVFPLRYRACGGDSYARGVENAGWWRLVEADSNRNMTYDEMARSIVDGWINSPSHHRNLVARNGDIEGLVGVGIASGDYSGTRGVYSTINVFFPWSDQVSLQPTAAHVAGG